MQRLREGAKSSKVRLRGVMPSGAEAEDLACRYLVSQGLTLLTRNFSTRRGEIDLIMQDRGVIVFIEVRFRRSNSFGSPAESITARKCARLKAAADAYLQRCKQPDLNARFDAVLLSPAVKNSSALTINWLVNILL